MRTVELTVDKEYVSGAGVVAGAKGTSSTQAHVTFSEEWEGLSKYVTTRDSKGENPTEVILGLDKLVEETTNEYIFTIPSSAMAEEGLMSVTFTGFEVVDGNEVSTATNTALASLRVLPSDYAIADDGSIDATLAEQLQAEIDEIKVEYGQLPDAVSHAQGYEQEAAGHATDASNSAILSESYAKGGTSSRTGEDTDNSLYYKNLCVQERLNCAAIADHLEGGFIPMGTIAFADLPSLADTEVGWTYNITDSFTTTSDFEGGSGISVGSGSYVYKTGNDKWDIIANKYVITHTFSNSDSWGINIGGFENCKMLSIYDSRVTSNTDTVAIYNPLTFDCIYGEKIEYAYESTSTGRIAICVGTVTSTSDLASYMRGGVKIYCTN